MAKQVERDRGTTAEEERRSLPRPSVFPLLRTIAVLLSLGLLCVTFPAHWGPAVTTWALKTFTPLGDSPDNVFSIDRISLTGLDLSGVRLGGFPTAPSCRSISVRYSPLGLCFSEIDSIRLEGLSFDPSFAPVRTEVSVPVVRRKSVPVSPDVRKPVDLLKGFSIFDFRVDGLSADFTSFIPPSVRESLPDGHLEATIEGSCDKTWRHGFRGKWRGTLAGGPFHGTLDYVPPYAAPSSNAVLRGSVSALPLLADETLPLPGPFVLDAEASLYEGRGLEVDFSARVSCSNTSWRLEGEGHYDALGYQSAFRLPKTTISEDEGLVATGVSLAPSSAANPLTELSFQASLAASATVTGVVGRLPEWQVMGRLSDCSFATRLGDRAVGVTGVVVRASCAGIGGHLSPIPVNLSFTNAYLEPFPFGRGYFQMTADRKRLVMTNGSVGFCGGRVRAYALYLTFEDLRSGFTLFLDQLDVDKIVKLLPGVGGSGKGRLYGQLPLRITAKKELRLRNAFLYARPGETGNIRFDDTGPIVSKLLEYGIEPTYCDTIGFALRNLDYDLLRFDLTRPRKEDGNLAIRLEGHAMEGKKPTPVTLHVNLNGPIEKLLNLGIKTATIGK